MATVQWVVLAHHKKEDGTYNPKIQITHKRTTSYMPTGIYTNLVRFRKGIRQGIITDPSVEDSLNDKIKSIRSILNDKEEIIAGMDNAKDVRDYILKILEAGKDIDFLSFAEQYKNNVKNPATKAYHVTRINALRMFVGEKFGEEKLPIAKITEKFLKEYEKWLMVTNRRSDKADTMQKGISVNSVNSYMGAVSVIFNAAKKEYNNYDSGDIIIKNDPFKGYRPPRVEVTKKRSVDAAVIRKIYEYAPKGEVPQMTRDLFLMSFLLAGMNVADFYDCGHFDDRIEYTRKKTRGHKKDAPYLSLTIHPIIKDLVDKYKDDTGEKGFIFHKMYTCTQAFHQALRRGIMKMRKDLDIPDLTFYAARHSFATIARNECDVSMDDIALCLTHESGHNITDTYVRLDFSRVDRVINKVAEYVFG